MFYGMFSKKYFKLFFYPWINEEPTDCLASNKSLITVNSHYHHMMDILQVKLLSKKCDVHAETFKQVIVQCAT